MKNDPKIMMAKYSGICAETGKKISKGDTIAFYPLEKKVFCQDSKQYKTALDFITDRDYLNFNSNWHSGSNSET